MSKILFTNLMLAMKKMYFWAFLAVCSGILWMSACAGDSPTAAASSASEQTVVGQSGVKDETSQPNVVQIAVGSKDHTTLVTAVKAANYVDVLSNAGPFTVFAPTNAAFNALPAGTVEGLLKPDKKADLQNILEYHVFVGVINADKFMEGKVLNQVNLKNVTLHVKDGKLMVNDANVIASIPASNGVVHVIDKVLLPQ